MRFSIQHRIEPFVGVGHKHYAYRHIYVADGCAYATNGRVLAVVPVEMFPGDVSGLLDPEVWEAAIKYAKEQRPKMDHAEVLLGKDIVTFPDGSEHPRCLAYDGTQREFAPVTAVIPKTLHDVQGVLSVPAKTMTTAIKALGVEEVSMRRIQDDGHKPILWVYPYKQDVAAPTPPFVLIQPLENQ